MQCHKLNVKMKTKEQNSARDAVSCIYDFNRKYVDSSKSKVKVRVKPLSNDKGFTIYLDWYEGCETVVDANGKSKVKTNHKYCFDFPDAGRLYLVRCGRYDTNEKEANDKAWNTAVAYRNRCVENLRKGLPAFITKSELDSQEDFLTFAKEQVKKEGGKDDPNGNNFNLVINHLTNYEFLKQSKYTDFKKFCEVARIPFTRITSAYITNFLEYLKTAKSYRKNAAGESKCLSANTSRQIQSLLNTLLNRAVTDESINLAENPFKSVLKRLPVVKTKKHFLTRQEVQLLIATDCKQKMLKDAFLFCCFTGLRFSDVTKLTWNNFDGNKLTFTQKKTKDEVKTSMPDEAKRFLPEFTGDKDAVLFPIKYNYQISRHLQKWMEAAGINKKIRFHSSRHTCAVLLLDSGANMYVTSKMLGHASMKTTEDFYADVIDERIEEAAANMNKYFNF